MSSPTSDALIESLPVWPEILDSLRGGENILLHSPRYYPRRDIILRIKDLTYDNTEMSLGFTNILLEPRVLHGSSSINYAGIWEIIRQTIALRSRVDVKDKLSLDRAIERAMTDGNDTKFVLLINAPGRGYEKQFYELSKYIHHLVMERFKNRIKAIITDDLSMFYFERALDPPESDLWGFRRIFISPLSFEETVSYVRKIYSRHSFDAETSHIEAEIFRLTGGHLGLIMEICRDLVSLNGKPPSTYFSDDAERRLAKGSVLEGIRADVQDDPFGIARTAIEFVSPNYVLEGRSPRYQFLRQIGVLRQENSIKAVLCAGIIGEFFKSLASIDKQTRVGTMMAPHGTKYFEDSALDVNEDDLVCLHISDLHVGESYGFNLRYPGGQLNPNTSSLPELVFQDLVKLGIADRLDSIIFSGDVVCKGRHDEFLRAREVIKELLKKCKISHDRLVVIPGNHDVLWDAGDLAAKTNLDGKTSHENFDVFRELIGLGPFNNCTITKIASRSGRFHLRIIGLDSNYIEGPQAAGIGFVQKEALDEVAKTLDRDISGTQKYVNWVVVHHHVLPLTSANLEEALTRRVSVMGNAAELLSRIADWNVELVLHGHEHQPGVTVANRWISDFLRPELKQVVVMGAGSCGAKREYLGPISRNHYFIIVRQGNSLNIRSRVMGDQGLNFVAHCDFRVPFGGPA
jgi:hypothetical protein